MRRLPNVLGALLLVAGCLGGQSGSPPYRSTPPDIDTTKIDPLPDGARNGTLGVAGEPGAVSPATGIVWAVNLETGVVPFESRVRSDGSFSIASIGDLGDAIRLQARDGARRLAPVDLRLTAADQPLEELLHPLDCLRTEPELELYADPGMLQVELTNDCDEAVELSIDLLLQGEGLSLVDAPSTIEAGAQANVEMELTDGADENVLRLRATSPTEDIRAVTITQIIE